MTAFLKIKREKYKNLQTKSVATSPGLPYISFGLNLNISKKLAWFPNREELTNHDNPAKSMHPITILSQSSKPTRKSYEKLILSSFVDSCGTGDKDGGREAREDERAEAKRTPIIQQML